MSLFSDLDDHNSAMLLGLMSEPTTDLEGAEVSNSGMDYIESGTPVGKSVLGIGDR